MITIESPPSRFARVVHLRALGLERAGSTQPATATAPGALAPHGSCLYDVLVWVVATHVVVAATVSALSGAGRTAVILVVFGAVVAITALHQHGSRAVRVGLAAIVGTSGVAHAVGVGVNRLTRVGLDASDALAVPAAAASLGLIVIAVADGVRGRTWRASLVAVPVVLVYLYYVLAPVTLGVWATHRIAEEPSDVTPASVDLEFEELTLTAADGTELAAWWIPGSNGAAVIVRHGASSDRAAVLDHVAVLADAGYAVLAMDARRHGSSGGEPNAFGWYVNDISGGVDLVQKLGIDARRIGVLGLSMGGEEAITAAATDRRIGAVDAEGGDDAHHRRLPRDRQRPGDVVVRPALLGDVHHRRVLSDASPPEPLTDAIAVIAPLPVLLIAAGDVDDEVRLGQRFAATAPATTQLWRARRRAHPGALHHTAGVDITGARSVRARARSGPDHRRT